MSYLVDGNNLMAQRVGWHLDKSAARRGLMDELAAHVARRRITLTIVFDGAPDESFPDGARYKGITLFYARRGSDADTRIKEFVEACTERRTLRVVTSDRSLAGYVKRCGAQVISSGEFRTRMNEAESKSRRNSAGDGERGGVKPDETKDWMRYFGVAPEDDVDGRDS